MRVSVRVWLAVLGATSLALAVFAAGSAASSGATAAPHICKGKLGKPGLLVGSYSSGVVVQGACRVQDGPVHVTGTLTVDKGSALNAAFSRNHLTHHGSSSLTVTGNLVVDKGATVVLGCKVNPSGSGFPCFDDPNSHHPTLTSSDTIKGSLIEHAPLGVVVHNSKISGNWSETGGGGGVNCIPTGPFKKLMSPAYSDIEDSSLGGNLTISGMKACWVGVARVHIKGSATFTNNDLADPDGIEIVSNVIAKSLSCTGNGHPPGSPPIAQPVWDSGDPVMGQLFPRDPEPNTVSGTRSGQCALSSPTTAGGALGPGAF